MKKEQGRLIIISSPSGGGKTTIVERLLKINPNLKRSISWTTRATRPSEHNGADYVFTSRADFVKKRKSRFFLEWANVYGQFYGTPLSSCMDLMTNGHDVVLAIDVQGMKKVKRKVGKLFALVTIFLMPPSIEILKSRLSNRKTETAKEIKKRITIAKKEIESSGEYHYVVVNRQIEKTVKQINRILYGRK